MSDTERRQSAVAQVTRKTGELDAVYDDCLAAGEMMLGSNRVTGHSLNLPIWHTCQPSKLCAWTCYYAKGTTTWPAALKRQLRVYNTIRKDPIAAAERLIAEYDRRRLTFMRWNGGGDLFAESVTMLNHVTATRPDIVIWCVTRHVTMAALVNDGPNLYLAFSVDQTSMERVAKVRATGLRVRNWFFSYQCAPKEVPTAAVNAVASVVFFDEYAPPRGARVFAPNVCPLAVRRSSEGGTIDATCEACRRCFSGAAVAYHREHAGRHDA